MTNTCPSVTSTRNGKLLGETPSRMYEDSSTATPLMVTGLPSPAHSTTSPGSPISRLMSLSLPKTPLFCSLRSQLAGSLNTTMSPRRRSTTLGARDRVSTRSPGMMVFSIDPLGMAYMPNTNTRSSRMTSTGMPHQIRVSRKPMPAV